MLRPETRTLRLGGPDVGPLGQVTLDLALRGRVTVVSDTTGAKGRIIVVRSRRRRMHRFLVEVMTVLTGLGFEVDAKVGSARHR